MTSHPSVATWHRLHPASILFRILGLGRNLLLPGIAVLGFAREGSWQIWLMVLFVPPIMIA